jgi:hypothetical protein
MTAIRIDSRIVVDEVRAWGGDDHAFGITDERD